MDTNNWRPPQGEPSMDGGDWRTQLMPESRHRIVNKIMETLKRHLPISGPEGLVELRKIAVRFEEKIYTAATSQSDYLRKLALKMLTMETKSHGGVTPYHPFPVETKTPLIQTPQVSIITRSRPVRRSSPQMSITTRSRPVRRSQRISNQQKRHVSGVPMT